MHELIDDITRWFSEGKQVALATVTRTWGSSPRGVGAKMAISIAGEMSGSVSGGCVEGAVVNEALEAMATGGRRQLHYGVADETAWEVGLACGGQIDINVTPLEPQVFEQMSRLAKRGSPFLRLLGGDGASFLPGSELLLSHERAWGSLHPRFDSELAKVASPYLDHDAPEHIRWTSDDGEAAELFLDIHQPAQSLIMIGGVHISIALATIANTLGYKTVIIDPRRSFGHEDRFQHVDQLISEWPQEAFESLLITEGTAIALLTHDPKIDDPALHLALNSRAFYIGALGSKGTQEQRRARLLDSGFSADAVKRVHGPVGLKIGARTPEEIALAIMAEIVAVKAKARRLSETPSI
jgi:xanthine dehydrogenase accessory factor